MHTPFFPVWRTRLAPMGQRVQHLRQQSLLHLDLLLGSFLPPGLLSQADEGPNSRERVYTVRRTFFGFLFQVLKPDCSCREVVRQILALCALHTNSGKAFASRWSTAPASACPIPRRISAPTPNPENRSRVAVFRCSSWSAYSAWPPGRCWTTPKVTNTSTNWACSSGCSIRSRPAISCWPTGASAPTR